MRVNWKEEAELFLVKRRVVIIGLIISAVAGALRFSHTPEEASAVAVAYFVSFVLGVWIGTRIWLALDKLLSREFRALRDRLASVEDRLDQFLIASGRGPQQYEEGARRRSWSQKTDIFLFSLAVRTSPICFLVATHNFFLAYIEWRTGILSASADFTALYFWLGCCAATIFVWGTVHKWLGILNARKTVGSLEKTLDLLESGAPIASVVTDRKTQEVYEKKLGFYEQIERLVYQWVGVKVPA